MRAYPQLKKTFVIMFVQVMMPNFNVLVKIIFFCVDCRPFY